MNVKRWQTPCFLIGLILMALVWMIRLWPFEAMERSAQPEENLVWAGLIVEAADGDILKALAEQAESDSKPSLAEFTKDILPAGDTYFTRHKGASPDISDDLRRRFIWTLSLPPEERLAVLEDLAATDNLFLKYRARLEILEIYLRLGKINDPVVQTLIRELMALPVEEAWKSDVYNMAGFVLLRQGDPRQAAKMITRAIELDPYYLNAYRSLIIVHLSTMALTDNVGRRCPQGDAVLESINRIVLLQKDPHILINIARDIERNAVGSPLKDLVVGYCYFHSGETAKAEALLNRAITGAAERDFCARQIQVNAGVLIERIGAMDHAP